MLPDTSPYGRMRDSAPLGIHTSPPGHSFSRHTTLTQSMDHLGLSHTLDRPPSPPKSWASQAKSAPTLSLSLPLLLVLKIFYMWI